MKRVKEMTMPSSQQAAVATVSSRGKRAVVAAAAVSPAAAATTATATTSATTNTHNGTGSPASLADAHNRNGAATSTTQAGTTAGLFSENSNGNDADDTHKPKQPATSAGAATATKDHCAQAAKYALHANLDKRPINELWAEYRDSRAPELREYFVERFRPLVRYNAERVHNRLPNEVDVEDLVQAGTFGLMYAIDAFDLEYGVKFETYCPQRIVGAILDELRSMDWVPRLVRQRKARVDQARQKFTMDEGRVPTEPELAEKLGLDPEDFSKHMRDCNVAGTFSLNRSCFQSDGSKDVREIDVIKDDRQSNPLSVIQRKDIKDLITKGLSRAERLIVILYYYEEMTMKEIGATLALSESRVSQMHSSILARLKAQMQHRARELEESDE